MVVRLILRASGDLRLEDQTFGELIDFYLRQNLLAVDIPFRSLVEELQYQLIVHTLEIADGNVTKAAKVLGMGRDQLRYRIEVLDIPGARKLARRSHQS